jgi:hypothetical protein
MSDISTDPRSAGPSRTSRRHVRRFAPNESAARPALRATRYQCQNCHAHTFLVLRTIDDAKCSVCESHDLAPVED